MTDFGVSDWNGDGNRAPGLRTWRIQLGPTTYWVRAQYVHLPEEIDDDEDYCCPEIRRVVWSIGYLNAEVEGYEEVVPSRVARTLLLRARLLSHSMLERCSWFDGGFKSAHHAGDTNEPPDSQQETLAKDRAKQ